MSAIRDLHTVPWLWAHRLLLAEFNEDADAAELVADEIGGCADCWRVVAHYCALLAALTTRPADYAYTVDAIYGSLEFALDTPDDVDLEICGDEDTP